MIVFYTCPRPVVLVSADDGTAKNIFPMNLMGPLGDGYFGFALNSERAAAPLVQRARRIALSTVPLEHACAASQLGANHKRDSIGSWNELRFDTVPSPTISVAVPQFALRVREVQVAEIRQVGSHTLFIANILGDYRIAMGLEFFVVHGIYQAWRQSADKPNIALSVAQDA